MQVDHVLGTWREVRGLGAQGVGLAGARLPIAGEVGERQGTEPDTVCVLAVNDEDQNWVIGCTLWGSPLGIGAPGSGTGYILRPDSGSGNDLISRKFLSKKDEKRIRPTQVPVTLNTANDQVVTSEEVPLRMSLTKERSNRLC